MERFQSYLRKGSFNKLFYDFEEAEVEVNGIRKKGGRGCDRAIVIRRGKVCKVVLVECKGGELGISDFEKGKNQLNYSIDFIWKAFDDQPDLAVICYEKFSAHVANYLRTLINKRVNRGVQLLLRKLSEDEYCSACSLF